MNPAKIHLSPDEMKLVKNRDWILTKRVIIQKVIEWMGGWSEEVKALLADFSLGELASATTPKISRGENFNGLPYVILDYPRLFGPEDIFAIRTFFWWGNYCSITLHLKGKWQQQYAGILWENRKLLGGAGFYMAIGSTEWEHAITDQEYILLKTAEPVSKDFFVDRPFLKITGMLPIGQWDRLDEWMRDAFLKIMQAIKN